MVVSCVIFPDKDSIFIITIVLSLPLLLAHTFLVLTVPASYILITTGLPSLWFHPFIRFFQLKCQGR